MACRRAAESVIIAAMTYIQPLLLVFLMVAFTGLVWREHGQKFRLPMLGLLGLLFLSWPPVDWLLSRPLEARYPVQPFPPAPVQAIVVLSSTVSPPRYERPYARPDKETYQRCEFAAWLHKNWRPLPVLACGGPGARAEPAVSVTMRQLLQQGGVPEVLIWTEERSHSTLERGVRRENPPTTRNWHDRSCGGSPGHAARRGVFSKRRDYRGTRAVRVPPAGSFA
jgi:hypothetical protein